MLKRLLLGALGLVPLLLKSQVSINAQIPPAGNVQKEQLWNMILTNNTDGVIDVSIKISLKNRTTGQAVLSAQVNSLSLGKDVRAISAIDVEPVTYTYSSSNFQTAYLPAGSYTTCYQVSVTGSEGQPFAEQCLDFNADPLNPPVLSFPLDQEEIQTPYPMFSWTGAKQSIAAGNLTYDLKVTVVFPGQTPADAIQNNAAVYSKTNLVQLSESYAANMKALKPDTLYAWQVAVKNAQGYTAKSTICTFKMNKANIPVTPDDQSYILLDDGTTGLFHTNDATLRVKYYSFNDEYTPAIKFTDANGQIVKTISKKIVSNLNYFDFDLQTFEAGKIYNLAFTDTDSKVHSLTFTIN